MYQHLIDRYNEHPDGDIEHIEFNKDEPYILDLTLYIYETYNKLSKDVQFLNLIKSINNIIYRTGLPEPSLTTITKPCSCLSHCTVSSDSTCCASLCGDNNHCMFSTDTHEYIAIVIVTILINMFQHN